MAKAVVDFAASRNIIVPEPDTFEQFHARGVKAHVAGRTVLVGNPAHLRDNDVVPSESFATVGETTVHVAVDGQRVGVIFYR